MWISIICAGIAILPILPFLPAIMIRLISGHQRGEAIFMLGTFAPLIIGIFIVLRLLVFVLSRFF